MTAFRTLDDDAIQFRPVLKRSRWSGAFTSLCPTDSPREHWNDEGNPWTHEPESEPEVALPIQPAQIPMPSEGMIDRWQEESHYHYPGSQSEAVEFEDTIFRQRALWNLLNHGVPQRPPTAREVERKEINLRLRQETSEGATSAAHGVEQNGNEN